jgi:hypothetical protein
VTSLSVDQRARLEDVVLAARGLLEADLVAVAAGRFGIDADGRVVDEGQLQLDPMGLVDRRELLTVLEYLRQRGADDDSAVTALIREAVFTHLNRLLSIRIAEQSGLFPQSLAAGRGSHGFTDLLELAPALTDDDTRGYAIYLALCGDELASDVPQLFDPRNPLLKLMPSPAALDDLVDLLSNESLSDLWAADDTLGWAYQFFNRKEERDAMREASATPRTSRELAVRNQFFTPGYVVDYLVQNTLGRHLVAHDPTGQLASQLQLLVDPPEYCGPPCDLDAIRVLDPAVGSGHFLLGAYDLLEKAWELAGVDPADAAPHILNSLWGIDIDLRPAQVAATALTLRARRRAKHQPLPSPHIVTARGLPELDPVILKHLDLSKYHVDVLGDVAEALQDAPLLGSALKAELALQDRLGRAGLPAAAGAAQPALSAEHAAFADDEAVVRDALTHLADATTSTPAERLFAAGADQALQLVEALTQRYDVVLMNPPFGDPITDTRDYLRAAYPWAPTRLDLLAIFVGRGLELCKPGGYLGAITGRAGLFTSTFQTWREQIILGHQLITLADLGFGVMEQAMVEASAYVLRNQTPETETSATFIRLLRDPDKASGLMQAITNTLTKTSDARIYRIAQTTFATLPGSPIAYSASNAILRLFNELRPIGERANVKQGLATGDDARFVRTFWEVDPHAIARGPAETKSRRWAPFAKGGDYGPYWSDIHLVVDYQDNGQHIKDTGRARVQNTAYYFIAGLTWPRRTNSALSVRVLPAGCVFADKGPSLFSDDPYALLAWLNSRIVRLLIDTTAASGEETQRGGVPSRSYEVGIIRSLPDPTIPDTDQAVALGRHVRSAVDLLAALDEYGETARRFVAPVVLAVQGTTIRKRAAAAYRNRLESALSVINAHDEIDRALSAALDPDGQAEPALYDTDGPLVTDLPADATGEATLLTKPVRDIVALATQKLGIARWIGLQHQVIDRRLELAATLEGVNPRSLVDQLPAGAVADDEPAASAHDLLSYLIGVAFGRWDIRIGADPTTAPPRPDPLEPVPLCPPGMLVGPDGYPATTAPDGYPIRLPPDGLLFDEPGHPYDIATAISDAAQPLFGDAAAILDELTTLLDASDLRTVVRRRFFRHHRTRYSKSKRTAPLYWPLTVPSRRWGIWLYAPTLRRDTLFAIVGAATARIARAESEILRLQSERDSGGAGRSAREVMTALTAEQELAEELTTFHREAERIANTGWIPNRNDGFALTAAPLSTLIPDWPELTRTLADIKAGKSSWASVDTWRDQL